MTQFFETGPLSARRAIAVNITEGSGPPVVWLSGFLSEMASAKGEAMAHWARENNRRLIRFDYSGHGRTGGDYTESTISDWLEEALAVMTCFVGQPPILVGSSMGGWIAVLAALALRSTMPALAPQGLALLAPAIDFTERLIWDRMPDDARRILTESGEFTVPSDYSATPYRFTRRFIEDGRKHRIIGREIVLGCPVRILQGMNDADVPWQHACGFAQQLARDDVTITLIRDGDHSLSRQSDIALLLKTVDSL